MISTDSSYTNKDGIKVMLDCTGLEVPVKYVSKYDRTRDKLVRRIHARFAKARADLEELVADCLTDLDVLTNLKGGSNARGNLQISSFDGSTRVELDQHYRIKLDERVAEARQIMIDYAERLAGKIASNDGRALMQIVKAAFAASPAGILPYAKILALLKLNITDEAWLKARQMLIDSIHTERGKAYLSCSVRVNREHDFVPIRLDIADCWPTDKEVPDDRTNA